MLRDFCRNYAWAIATALFLVVMIAFFLFGKQHKVPPSVVAIVTVTATPTPTPIAKATAPKTAPRFAIVIDDIGFSKELAEHYFKLSKKITLAVIPAAPHATALAKSAHQHGHEILIHLPMEPMDRRRIEAGSLELAMSDAELAATVKEAVAIVPFAVGINNHTGSRMTADLTAMRRLAGILKPYNFFILDSRTSTTTKLAQAAAENGIPHISRDIFLDNDKDPAHILKQLEATLRHADQHGKAVAIGHPYIETSSTLKAFFSKHPERLEQLQPLSELVFN